MTRLLLIVAAALLPLAAAGELADLHARLAEPVEAAPAEPGREGVTQIATPTPPLPDIARIGLERSNCFTGCPAFTLIVEADGRFRWVGEANVERLGAWTGQIEQGSLNQVFRYIGAIDYAEFDDSYLSPFLDNAATFTMVVMGGETKVVQNYANTAPATVWALERLIEDLLEVATWDE